MKQAKGQAAAIQKLGIKLGDAALAAKLVAAGFDNPAKLRQADDADLEAIEGIGKATVARVRGKLPRRG